MELERIAENINILGDFCGKRDVADLTPGELLKRYGIRQADVMVLFGGSILCGGDVLAQAIRNQAAKKYRGHPSDSKESCFCDPIIDPDKTPAGTLTAVYPPGFWIGSLRGRIKATPHNSTCRYGERGVPAAKQKAQIILCVLSSIFATQMVRRSRRSGV